MKNSKNIKVKVANSSSVSLHIRPETFAQGDVFFLSGEHWPAEALMFRLAKNLITPQRVLKGNYWSGMIVPDAEGNFLLEFPTASLKPGKYVLETVTQGEETIRLTQSFTIRERIWPGENVPRAKVNKPALRNDAFNERRFGKTKGSIPGLTDIVRRDWLDKHTKIPQGGGDIIFYSAPVPGACNWTPMGPAPFSEGKGSSFGNNSGRIRSIAIHPTTPSVMYVGTAAGGVWKSEDSGLTWLPKTDDKFSLAIGALAIDPVTHSTVYAGTGEYIPNSNIYYYGNGLLKSTNSGDSWTEIGTSEFSMAEISRILINPADALNLYVSASNGIWESINGGGAWTQISTDPATDIVLVHNPAEPGTKRLLAGFANMGVYMASNTGSSWSTFSAVTVPGAPVNSGRVVFGVCRTLQQHIYAAFTDAGGNSLAHVARSINYGVAWSACVIPGGAGDRLYQGKYNMAILPHPTNPETVILTVVDVFKSTTGGSSWTTATFSGGNWVHADCHAIAFNPTLPNRLFVTCDGGLFYSPDLCASWEARNLDLSTIQMYDFGQHPQYEAILIAGSLDNGGFHYNGAPIWFRSWVNGGIPRNAMTGDAVVANIDPFNGYIHYYGTGPEGSVSRSDDAGRFFPTFWSKPAGSPWWIPFFPDTRTEGVLFMGGTQLMRSNDRGNTWTSITTALPSPVRAVGFHPTDPLVIYAGTTGGHVFRLQGPVAGAWDSSTVTRTDVTYTGLPIAKQVSSLAVDPSGNVWVTFSSLMEGEDPGEFTNHHVYRLDSGTSAWLEKASGLVIANPVNTIVIDPLDANKLYCGADRGVYRWDSAFQNWTTMDEGLPNAPVMLLKIHSPSRKLRAATFGRGLWERHLISASCSNQYLYMRSHIADSGAEPAADAVAHPYLGGHLCWHWQSPDIIVDPVNQTPSAVTSPMQLYDKVIHYGGRRGSNRVYVTVHNKGPFSVSNVRVRAFFADASGGLPAFPAGLLANPFTWTPPAGPPVAWNPVGAVFPISSLDPGNTRMANWPSFVIPMTAPRHSCIMAFVSSDQDTFTPGGISNPDELVLHNRKVALKNLDLDGPAYEDSAATIVGSGGGSGSGSSGGGGSGTTPPGSTAARSFRLNSSEKEGAWYNPLIYCANLPNDALIILATNPVSGKMMKKTELKPSAQLKKIAEEFKNFKNHPKELKGFDLSNLFLRDVRKGSFVTFDDIYVSRDKPVDILIWIWSASWDQETEYSYDFVQWQGQNAAGGFTVFLKGMGVKKGKGK